MVSGSVSLPSRGSFHLSLTVLCAIGHLVVFSLGRWSSRLPTGLPILWYSGSHSGIFLSPTGLSPSLAGLPRSFRLRLILLFVVLNPGIYDTGLGSSLFARHYSGNRLFSFFSSRYLDVSVHAVSLLLTIYSSADA